MWIILMAIIVILYFVSVPCRIAFKHPILTVVYAVRDTYEYFAYKLYNKMECGKLSCYDAHFGGGKTLSGTHFMRALFVRYNNKKYYDKQRGIWVLQKVLIVSNVKINGIYHETLVGLKQFVEMASHNKKIDDELGTRTCVIGFIDEASSQLNSRNFKNNIDATFLNTLITCRHYNMSLYYTSQKFKLVDALLRSVTQTVIWCDKKWRLMVQFYFDADEMEYATNPTMVKSIKTGGFFIRNKDFESYDTLATVEKLERDCSEGKMLSEAEILALRGDFYGDNDMVDKPSRKLKRLRNRA